MSGRTVAVVGAGLAGLAAAASASEAGADVVVFERDDAPGGATIASAGWIWRYRDMVTFRRMAPHGDERVQRAVVDQLAAGAAWLERLGVRRIASDTGRAFSEGIKVDPAQALDALSRRLPADALQTRATVCAARRTDDEQVELLVQHEPLGSLPADPPRRYAFDAVVFAGGGYAADLSRVAQEAGVAPDVRMRWRLRARRAGDGTSMDAALGLGAGRVPITGECYVRLVPADAELRPRDVVRFGELQEIASALLDDEGFEVPRPAHDWAAAVQGWTLARRTGEGWLQLSREAMRSHLPSGRAEDVVRSIDHAGARVDPDGSGGVAIRVAVGITHTLCGLRIDEHGRVLVPASRGLRARATSRPLAGLYAAGCDAGGVGAGGYASGLGQALVLGRCAGADAADA